MEIYSLSPNRIDFSGGSLDLYPINIIEEGITLNSSISIWSAVKIVRRSEKGFKIISEGDGRFIEGKDLNEVAKKAGFELVIEAIKAFQPPWDFEILIKNDAPTGSGLGASSSLLVSLITGLMKARGEALDCSSIIRRASIIETRLLKIPVGTQDYFAAVYGGFNLIHNTPDGERREGLHLNDFIISSLNRRLILSYTDVSHNSAEINWRIIKDYIDGRRGVREALKNIKAITMEMVRALVEGKIDEVGRLMDEEWKIRRDLVKGISVGWIEDFMQKIKRSGAIGGKLCGAGGGGCMITLAEEDRVDEVTRKLQEGGFKILKYKFVGEGVKVFEKKGVLSNEKNKRQGNEETH